MTARAESKPSRKARGSSGRPLSSARGVLVAVTAVHVLLLAVASVLYPLYRAPDESAHLDLVRRVAAEVAYPTHGDEMISRQVADSYELIGHDPHDPGRAPALRRADAVPRSQRPAYPEIAPDTASWRPQHMTQHPPLYYGLLAVALRGVEVLGADRWSFDQTGGFLRLLNVLLIAPLPLLFFAAARRSGAIEPVALGAAVLPVAIPQLTHIGSAVNNDNLLVLLGAAITVLLAAVATGDASRRTAFGLGALGGLALLTKGFALSLPLWVLLAYGVAALRGMPWRWAAEGAGASLGLSALVGGWWWLRNLVELGVLQPTGIHLPAAPEGFSPDLPWWVGFFSRRFIQRFWIEPNVLPPGAGLVETFAMLALLAGVVAAFVVASRHRVPRPVALAVLGPAIGIGGVVVYGAWSYYATSAVPFGIHGRYLYPALAGLAVVAAAGWVALARERAPAVPLMVLVAAIVLQGRAAVFALRFYWDGGPQTVLAWSPWPAAAVVVAVALLAAAVAAALVLTSRIARTGS